MIIVTLCRFGSSAARGPEKGKTCLRDPDPTSQVEIVSLIHIPRPQAETMQEQVVPTFDDSTEVLKGWGSRYRIRLLGGVSCS